MGDRFGSLECGIKEYSNIEIARPRPNAFPQLDKLHKRFHLLKSIFDILPTEVCHEFARHSNTNLSKATP